MTVTIEAGDAADTDAIAELWVALATDQRAYGSHLLAEENREQIRDAIARHVVLDGLRVARPESEDSDLPIVGFVMFDVETGAYEQDVDRGIVRNLFVRPGHRDEGIGGALLSAAEEALADAGADVVALEAMFSNEDARRFYMNQGYYPHRVEFEKRVGNDTHSKVDR